MAEVNRLELHLIKPLGERRMQAISREEMQELLDTETQKPVRSMVDHLRFRLRSMFELAMSETFVDRNPAARLFTPRQARRDVDSFAFCRMELAHEGSGNIALPNQRGLDPVGKETQSA